MRERRNAAARPRVNSDQSAELNVDVLFERPPGTETIRPSFSATSPPAVSILESGTRLIFAVAKEEGNA